MMARFIIADLGDLNPKIHLIFTNSITFEILSF